MLTLAHARSIGVLQPVPFPLNTVSKSGSSNASKKNHGSLSVSIYRKYPDRFTLSGLVLEIIKTFLFVLDAEISLLQIGTSMQTQPA